MNSQKEPTVSQTANLSIRWKRLNIRLSLYRRRLQRNWAIFSQSWLGVLGKHLLPSVLPLAALQMMTSVSGAVIADGFISFFGLTRSVSNWGTVIYDAFVYGTSVGDIEQMLHVLIPAAACFTLFALGFYLVSRGLQRVVSPITREQQ